MTTETGGEWNSYNNHILDAFIAKYSVDKDAVGCPFTLLGKPCGKRPGFCKENHYPPLADHSRLWLKDGSPELWVTQPYGPLDHDAIDSINSWAEKWGLAAEINADRDLSWHSPGATQLVIVRRAKQTNPLADNFLARFLGAMTIGTHGSLRRGGEPVTNQEPATLERWASHLDGGEPLRIAPERADKTCVFGVIDIYHAIDLPGFARWLADERLPLMVLHLEHGGARLVTFSSEPVPAVVMNKKLTEVGALLDAYSFDVLPQPAREAPNPLRVEELVEQASQQWPMSEEDRRVLTAALSTPVEDQPLDMPYFPGSRTYALDATGEPLSAEKFLAAASVIAKPLAWFLMPLDGPPPQQSTNKTTRDLIKPHRAHMDAPVTGNIENWLFSELGRFICKNRECVGAILDVKIEEMLASCDPVPVHSDLVRLRKQLKKHGTRYSERASEQSHHTFDEVGQSLRFIDYYGDRFRYNVDTGEWLSYDGSVWKTDTHAARGAMEDISDTLHLHEIPMAQKMMASADQAEQAAGKVLNAAAWTWYGRSRSTRCVNAALASVENKHGMRVGNTDLDANDYIINTLNGTVDLRSGELLEHNPADMCTKCTDVRRDETADQTEWTSWLETMLENDQEVISWLQEAAGYSLTGLTRAEKIFFNQGLAATGKTTFIEAIALPMGDYATTIAAADLVEKRFQGIPTEIAVLAGMRLVRADEFKNEVILATDRLKLLTGGSPVSARKMRQDTFSFKPKLKLWLSADSEPSLSSGDSGMWRRFARTPFNYAIPVEKRDEEVKASLWNLEKNGSAILEWCIQGAVRYLAKGKLVLPTKVQTETDKYQEDSDDLKDFLEDWTDTEEGARTPISHLFGRYLSSMAHDNVKNTLTIRGFAKKMKDRKIKQGKSNSVRFFVGIKMKPTPTGM